MKLAIISHTPHYKTGNTIKGWGPTVREINHLSKIFDEVYHIAPLHGEAAPPSSLAYENEKIIFIPIKPFGGTTFREKISILTTSIHNLKAIRQTLKKVDWVQFRAPTAMGLYVLPYLSLRDKPKRWVKYAGNWQMEDPPLSYRFQKWWLEKNFQKSIVTINGTWKDQKPHILNFENPCFDNEELKNAVKIGIDKNFDKKLTLCFAGALLKNKGVDLILMSLRNVRSKPEIEELIFAGDGNERKRYEEMAKDIDMKITFTGFLSRQELEKIYAMSHLILLPSESEGFPKVIAEAASFGCVPVVSDVSSIGQYFNETNSYLLKRITPEELSEKIHEAIMNRAKLKKRSLESMKAAGLFTYENYIKNLNEKILKEIIFENDPVKNQ
ncbi:MAG: glycosyltransferase family 4 protein [Ignavibacteria bacterium]